MPKWKKELDQWVEKKPEFVKKDEGDINDQEAWLTFSLQLQGAVMHCDNRVELVDNMLSTIELLQEQHKFPAGFHAKLAVFFDPDRSGELLIGDLERRQRDRDA